MGISSCLTTPAWRRVARLCLFLGSLAGARAWGQAITPTGPVGELELVSLASDVPLDQALRIIQTFARQAVVEGQHLTDPIGVEIDRLPWRRALEQIALHQGMEIVDQEHYLELRPLGPGKAQEASPAGITLDSREVNISAVFFQADRSALQEIGIDWSTLSGGRVDVSAAHLGARRVSGEQFSLGAQLSVNRSLSVDLLLRTLEAQNAGQIIARPQIKVRSGQKGYIQVGSDFSVTTADFAGNAITRFVSTGTILDVQPTVLSQEGIDFVDLKVTAERSSLVDPVRNLVSKTLANTATLLRDGEQTAIGGLYGQEISVARTGVPKLKDLPPWFFGLRYLFGHDSQLVSNTELVVMIRVSIVPSVRQRSQANSGQEENP
jgi:type IV pilus assembly protein PilQ